MGLEEGHSIWIGRFEVLAPPDNAFFEGDAGAFVWVAAQATSAQHLCDRMAHAMRDLGLTVVESEELSEVVDEDLLSDALWDLLPEAKRHAGSVVCGTWHRFKNQDA